MDHLLRAHPVPAALTLLGLLRLVHVLVWSDGETSRAAAGEPEAEEHGGGVADDEAGQPGELHARPLNASYASAKSPPERTSTSRMSPEVIR
jgi:hypothetical protein